MEPMDDTAAAEAAEAARLQADARRKRILEKADRRMDAVSGEQVMEEEEKAASVAKAARIRAARQRRYGKKPVPSTDVTDEVAVSAENPVAATDSTEEFSANGNDVGETSSGKPFPKSEPDTVAETDSKTKEQLEGDSEERGWPEDEVDSGSSAPEGSKKKYLGVARMRRNALKKKKDTDFNSPPIGIEEIDVKSGVVIPTNVSKLPIYMHICVILLLFVAGLDVSLQQYYSNVQVESSFSIVQHGFPMAHRSLGPVQSKTTSTLIVSEPRLMAKDDFQDEFDASDVPVPNIDPVFGVDLDALTNGPGLMKQLARGAVSVHRMILYLVYLFPLSMLNALVGIPRAFLRSPPALCFVSMLVRHGLGKTILGAGLPLAPHASEKSFDVLAMAKNFVSNFLSTAFPMAVTIYEAFSHLRSDMYIVLCGFFTGLVYVDMMVTLSRGGEGEPQSINDEL